MAAQTAAPARPARAPAQPGQPPARAEMIVRRLAGARLRLTLIQRFMMERSRHWAGAVAGWIGGLWELSRREGIPRLLVIMMMLHLSIASVVYLAERSFFVPAGEGDALLIDSLRKAFWWAIVTMTTVGYGDLYPKTEQGKIFAGLLMVSGSLLLSMFTASFASMLVARRLQENQGLSVLKVKRHTIIIGWNRNAEQLIAGLIAASERRPQIVLINQLADDQLGELRFKYRNLNLLTVRGDATHLAILERANLATAAGVIILADQSVGEGSKTDDRALFVALAVRDANADVKISVEILDHEKETALRNAGVDEIVVAGQDTAFFLVAGSMAPGLARAARHLLTYGSGHELRRIELARELRGLTFRDARAYYRTNGDLLVGIISEGSQVTISEVLGSSTDWVDDFIRLAFQSSGSDVVAEDTDRTQAIIPPSDDYVIGNKDSGVIVPRS